MPTFIVCPNRPGQGWLTNVTLLAAPWKDLVADYGAVGDALRVLDGAMTSASANLSSSSATFTSADVGKAIGVVGAGAAGVNLITTIATFTDSHNVVLTVAASTTVSSAHVVYGHDDTAAFQSALNAAGTTLSLQIRVPSQQYFIAGPMLQTSTGNAQILFPTNSQSNAQFSIYLRGDIPQNYAYWTIAAPLTQSGAVIHSLASPTTAGWSGPAIFGGGSISGGAQPGSAINFRCENIIFRTYPDPGIGCVNGQNIDGLQLDGVLADTGVMNLTDVLATTPTKTNCVAFAWPQTDSPCMQVAGIVVVVGYYTGVRWFEFFQGYKVLLFSCWYGADLPATYHASNCNLLNTTLCKYGIFASGVSTTSQQFAPSNHKHSTLILHDIEHDTGGSAWYAGASSYDLYDPNNLLVGQIWGHTVQTASGVDNNYRKSGGTGATVTVF